MNEKTLFKSAVLSLIIVLVAVVSYEIYLRGQGIPADYDDNSPLWANTRAKACDDADKTIVFIGSSRIKFDLDIPTWNALTRVIPVQLAMVGSCPRPALEDLANDPTFKGKLVIDVTERLFFTNAPPNQETPNKNIKYFHERTPAQRASFEISKVLESQLSFLDQGNLSLNARLDALELESRPGVFMMPIFPMYFDRTTYERQSYMTATFVADTQQQNKVKAIWAFFGKGAKMAPPPKQSEYDAIFKSVVLNVNKIKARGGTVAFVRTPSSGPYYQEESMGFPRDKFWDRLLKETNCAGFYFKDYPAIANFECPEFSHLKRPDAVIFTKHFFEYLSQQKGFTYLQSNKPQTN
ncbi:hypothetical protein QWY90_07280 [Flavobacterium paronense]|uniref:SGNH/GDSL hydrolase family protein n=1 Tax=Flavobacterium paronense TaxID=1392775 RepID=A0ABV5GGL0_9FLAO|nr:hypothetical protein [Flavobacterium paronense]MDN3677112.1 hypothetical protein [Flavobacterium paronense]